MHDFLRSIGFSSITKRKELDVLIEDIIKEPHTKQITPTGSDYGIIQLDKSFGPQFGITLIGDYDSNGFHLEHLFPYCKGAEASWEENMNLKKIASILAYEAYCDDLNIGCPLIFFLQNISQYVRRSWSNVPTRNLTSEVYLGGLSTEGSIILGAHKSNMEVLRSGIEKQHRQRMILSARNGDTDAMENLTTEDMNTYALLSQRLLTEDILSIVDTSMIPYGVECDQYSIIGVITTVNLCINQFSAERVWLLGLNCNEICMSICINEKDLMGEPEVGRRFKGIIWLQGNISW